MSCVVKQRYKTWPTNVHLGWFIIYIIMMLLSPMNCIHKYILINVDGQYKKLSGKRTRHDHKQAIHTYGEITSLTSKKTLFVFNVPIQGLFVIYFFYT